MKYILAQFLFLFFLSNQCKGQSDITVFFNESDRFFKTHVIDGRVDYLSAQKSKALSGIVKLIEDADLSDSDNITRKAFYLNVYNLLVIDKVIQSYPLTSVKKAPAFFTRKDLFVEGHKVSLTDIEKELLFANFNDPRMHFVLVCAAISCPEIANFAYTPDRLDHQLNQQVKRALNNPLIIEYTHSDLRISEIFNWYRSDFGGGKEAIFDFIRKHRKILIQPSTKLKYLPYNWRLNDLEREYEKDFNLSLAPSSARYVVSSVIPEGQWEIKLFNNLYSQLFHADPISSLSQRQSFLTQTLNILYGYKPRFNFGLSTRYRKTINQFGPSSAFDILGKKVDDSRSGLTAIGPQVRFAPIEKWTNFSIQSTLSFAIGSNLEGEDGSLYIDWSNPSWQTQVFNDFTLSNHFSLFTEIDFFIEDIGSLNRFSTPVTFIFSYFPVKNMTLYTLGSYSPFWQSEYDYYYQYGLGTKYQFSPKLEIEFLYTDFTTAFLKKSAGSAATYNFGIRFNI